MHKIRPFIPLTNLNSILKRRDSFIKHLSIEHNRIYTQTHKIKILTTKQAVQATCISTSDNRGNSLGYITAKYI